MLPQYVMIKQMIEQAPRLEDSVSIDVAWLYCATLIYNGYNDWRMPTSIEADSNEWIDTDIGWHGLYADCVYTVTPVRDV